MAVGETEAGSLELGPIRPPSEAYSLLLRVTRNCPWNRCKFCGLYKGQQFGLRSVDEIKREIQTVKVIHDQIKELAGEAGRGSQVAKMAAAVFNNAPSDAYRQVALWLHAGGRNVFLQDANTLIMPTDDLVEIIRFLKETFPGIERITSYGRSKTAARKSLEELKALHDAGLTRLHLGLESGYDPLLAYMNKGVTAAEHIAGGEKVVASGISLCEYVVLGLGGRKWWREHAAETAKALNEINPDFIRVRTLTVNRRMPLYQEVANGSFLRATDEEIIEEEKRLIEHLECSATYVSDHITNLLPEIEGKLPEDKARLLAVIRRFQALPPAERTNFIVGRRAGLYVYLGNLADERRHKAAEQVVRRLTEGNGEVPPPAIYAMMEPFI